jgi:hypothetical protein
LTLFQSSFFFNVFDNNNTILSSYSNISKFLLNFTILKIHNLIKLLSIFEMAPIIMQISLLLPNNTTFVQISSNLLSIRFQCTTVRLTFKEKFTFSSVQPMGQSKPAATNKISTHFWKYFLNLIPIIIYITINSQKTKYHILIQ